MADTMKFVGQAMPKVDSLARLTGLAQYTDDMPLLPRTAHGMLIHSPYAHARIKSIDSTKAEAVDGVLAVLDYRRPDETGLVRVPLGDWDGFVTGDSDTPATAEFVRNSIASLRFENSLL